MKLSRRKALRTAALLVVLAAGCVYEWMALWRHGFLPKNKWDRREQGTLKVGDLAPDFALPRYDGSTVRLSSLWAERPVVLVFGSCT